MINTIAGNTAVGTIMDSIAKACIENGHEVFIASGYGVTQVAGCTQIMIGTKKDRLAHVIFTRINDSHGLHSTRPTLQLIDAIESIRPDIIHIHNLHGYYLNYPILIEFLKHTKIPIVWTMHDCWAMTGHCAYPQFSDCNKYKDATCHNCNQSNAYPKSFFDNSAKNIKTKKDTFSKFNNLHIVTVSQWLGDILNDSWLNGHPSYTIYNGIDTTLFSHKETECAEKETILGVANVWTKDKGILEFIKLRKLISKKYKMLIIGANEVQSKLIFDGVDIQKYISQKDLPQYYSNALATINLSKAETFGMTIIESLACETPVISYDNTAPHEIISPDCGFLVATYNNQAIADIINSGNIYNIKPKQCREKVLNSFTQEKMTSNYLYLYHQLS